MSEQGRKKSEIRNTSQKKKKEEMGKYGEREDTNLTQKREK